MIDVLILIIWVIGLLICIAVAVDVITQHPYDWSRSGSSQKFRLVLIVAPLFAIPILPLGLAPGLFYLGKVRPLLVHSARIATSQGWPVAARRPVLGLDWVWQELRTWQKIKAAFAVVGAGMIDTLLILAPETQDDIPQWLKYAAFIFLLPDFFVTLYLCFSAFQMAMPAIFNDSGVSPAQVRIQQLVNKEYLRRNAEFQQRHMPRPPWDQRRW